MTLETHTNSRPRPGVLPSVLPLFVLLGCLGLGAGHGAGAPLLVVSMLVAAAVAGGVAIAHGARWRDIERATGAKLAAVLPAILILLAIGLMIGTWMLSGTIPLLVAWGVRLIDPGWLVPAAFLLTAAMSLLTGTSWGSAGTLGVALMGTAAAVDAPLAATAGAVVSGAYFGDKLSPLSDSTNLCALGARADLFAHIRHLLYTAVPSFVVALVVYVVAGRSDAAVASGSTGAGRLVEEISLTFRGGPWVLLPVVVVVAGIVLRRPPALALAASALVAAVVGVAYQGFSVVQAVAVAVDGFDVSMLAGRADLGTLSDGLVRLLTRGGMASMATTLLMIISAFLLAGALDVSGALQRIVDSLLATARGVAGLIAATMAAGATMIALTSHGGVTALVVGGLFRDAYRERGLAAVNLSRSLEDSVTLVEPLLPWTVSALFMATTLGVPTLDYLPWAVFLYGGPAMSLLIAVLYRRTGIGITRASDDVPV